MKNNKKAFLQWEIDLGKNNVLFTDEATEIYGKNTNGGEVSIAGALLPHSTEEVQSLVHTANCEKVPLYPISTGNNWGYGSSMPVTHHNVIVDLKGMDKIVDFDTDLGIVTIQPGVTQEILHEYIEKNNLPFITPVTGAGPHCSILANILERGYGITPIADHFSALTSLHVVLPDGSLYRSALEEMGGTLIDRAYKYGIGPYLNGLFTQSNFGIVVQASIVLAPKPAHSEIFYFTLKKSTNLEMIVPSVSKILSSLGLVIGGINLMNQERVDSMSRTLSRHKESTTPSWTGIGVLYGEKCIVDSAKPFLRKNLKKHVNQLFFIRIDWFKKIYPFLAKFPLPAFLLAKLETFYRSIDLFLGIPSTVALPLAYKKSGTLPKNLSDADVARDGCGLIWFTPLVPMKPDLVEKYIAVVRRVCTKFEVEPLITLSSLNERCFDSTVPLLFDKSNGDAIEKARACYDALWSECEKLHIFPYRLPTDEMHRITQQENPFWHLIKSIKNAIDPKGIISPGRYSRTE
ncbi:MAG: FAD-binding oxidoreductase [Minisyncoccia bacterium]